MELMRWLKEERSRFGGEHQSTHEYHDGPQKYHLEWIKTGEDEDEDEEKRRGEICHLGEENEKACNKQEDSLMQRGIILISLPIESTLMEE